MFWTIFTTHKPFLQIFLQLIQYKEVVYLFLYINILVVQNISLCISFMKSYFFCKNFGLIHMVYWHWVSICHSSAFIHKVCLSYYCRCPERRGMTRIRSTQPPSGMLNAFPLFHLYKMQLIFNSVIKIINFIPSLRRDNSTPFRSH